ncbi:MAG: hypothetical protein [Siphoviridae sp. ct7UA22]|nr:MAG: hypothetical protein [Siphoviridae sp. ct7UA22]
MENVTFVHYSVGEKVVITAHNGKTRSEFEQKDVVDQVVIDAASFPDVLETAGGEKKSIKAYGISSLLQDRSSQAKGPAEKFEYMKAEAERLQTEGALWSEARESAPKAPKAPKVDAFLVAAIAELKGVTQTVASVFLSKLDKEQVKELAARPAVQAAVEAQRKAAEAADDIDLSDLLA